MTTTELKLNKSILDEAEKGNLKLYVSSLSFVTGNDS